MTDRERIEALERRVAQMETLVARLWSDVQVLTIATEAIRGGRADTDVDFSEVVGRC